MTGDSIADCRLPKREYFTELRQDEPAWRLLVNFVAGYNQVIPCTFAVISDQRSSVKT